MPEKDADNYRFDILDITKVWPHSDYPLKRVGKEDLKEKQIKKRKRCSGLNDPAGSRKSHELC
jgi:hypothetical protein